MGRLFTSVIVVIAISILSAAVQAQTAGKAQQTKYKKVLIFSDIDDTIKVSHILDTAGKLSRSADVTTPFTGMAQLYQLVINATIASQNSSAKIVYLSNAPEQILGIPAAKLSHQTFLSYNNFPPGELDLREDIFEQNHKIKELRRIIDAEMPDAVIMIGDNGERDAEVYHQVVQDYANMGIKMVTFIHQLYATKIPFYQLYYLAEVGKNIFSEQYGYVTPIEIALQLKDEDLLDQAGLDWMLKNVSPYIVEEDSFKFDRLKPVMFPNFSNCSDFRWRWANSKAALSLSIEGKTELKALVEKINSQCN